MKRSLKNNSKNGSFPHQLLEDAAELASYKGWREQEYRDLLAVQRGELSAAQFKDKYSWQTAIMVLDMTGFTMATMQHGDLAGVLRIVEAHKVCLPVLKDSGAGFVRSFADDLVALFEDPHEAVVAAFEIHDRVRLFRESGSDDQEDLSCCIGIGYGQVMKIGPNLAQGDEMNRASRLGEDIAKGEQTLVTENVFRALEGRAEVSFRNMHDTDDLFPFYEAIPMR